MTALTKLLELNSKLPIELRAQQFLLINELHNEFKDEKSKLMDEYERIIRAMQDSKTYDVVAIAGTAEQLLTDVINVGDTVELNTNIETDRTERRYLEGDNIKQSTKYVVLHKHTFDRGVCIGFNGCTYWHRIELFRKVSTPIVNPIKTV